LAKSGYFEECTRLHNYYNEILEVVKGSAFSNILDSGEFQKVGEDTQKAITNCILVGITSHKNGIGEAKTMQSCPKTIFARLQLHSWAAIQQKGLTNGNIT
jgi:hypothetical protein